jgi:hypothetical protein
VTGVGKSVVMADALARAAKRGSLLPATINFSAQTTSLETQLLMEGRLEKKRKTRWGGAGRRLGGGGGGAGGRVCFPSRLCFEQV